MSKIQHFSACQGEEYFTARPHPSRRGDYSFISIPPTPQAGQNSPCSAPSAPTRENSPSTLKPPQNQRFFTSRANFFSVSPRIHTCWASFFTPMGATATSQHPPTASPETDDTNAGGSLPQNETTGTSASSSPHTFETTDTFAHTKRPNSGHFPAAKASPVTCIPRRATAKASPVSSDAK